MFKRLYAWTIALAESRYAPFALALVSFAESSFFPIPPDVMLIPMAVAQPRRAWFFAGDLHGRVDSRGHARLFYRRRALYDSVGVWLIDLYGGASKVESLRESYQKWGAALILIKGVTPIPYKFVTIVSGFLGYNFALFVILSAITRGARFFIVAGLLNRFGESIKGWLEQHFGLFIALLAIALIGGIFVATRLF